MGVIKYTSHSGYIASLLNEDDLLSVKTTTGGIYRRLKNTGDGVERGDALGEIIHLYEGQVISPTDGIIIFAHTSPLVMENVVAFKIIRRLHE